MKLLAFLIGFCVLCYTEHSGQQPAGSELAVSEAGFEETYSELKKAISSSGALSILAEIDHSNNAENAGLELMPSRLIILTNPALEAAAMRQDQTLGLELPLKLLLVQTTGNEILVIYNSLEYLNSRYNIPRKKELRRLYGSIEDIVESATGNRPKKRNSSRIYGLNGTVTRTCSGDYTSTYNNLKASIMENNELEIMAEVDHQQKAVNAGIGLRDSGLIIFGNPKAGTRLMQQDRIVGLDLPLKVLVWQDEDGSVKISYTRPGFLKKRYAMEEHPVFANMDKLLKKLVKASFSE